MTQTLERKKETHTQNSESVTRKLPQAPLAIYEFKRAKQLLVQQKNRSCLSDSKIYHILLLLQRVISPTGITQSSQASVPSSPTRCVSCLPVQCGMSCALLQVTWGCCSAAGRSAAARPQPAASWPPAPPAADSGRPSATAPSGPSSVSHTHRHTGNSVCKHLLVIQKGLASWWSSSVCLF